MFASLLILVAGQYDVTVVRQPDSAETKWYVQVCTAEGCDRWPAEELKTGKPGQRILACKRSLDDAQRATTATITIIHGEDRWLGKHHSNTGAAILFDATKADERTASPAEAAVIVHVRGKDSGGVQRWYSGCGTATGENQILTCGHLGRGLADAKYTVQRKAEVPATVLKLDTKADLCLLSAEGFPGVELAETNAPVTSVHSFDQHGRMQIGWVSNSSGDTTATNSNLSEGDSGCGLFRGDRLCGVFSGIARDGTNRRLFANVDAIKAFLGQPILGEAVSIEKPRFPRVLMFTGTYCPPCQAIKRNDFEWLKESGWDIGDGDRSHLQVVDVSASPELAVKYNVTTIPQFVLIDADGEVSRSRYNGRSTYTTLLKALDRPEKTRDVSKLVRR